MIYLANCPIQGRSKTNKSERIERNRSERNRGRSIFNNLIGRVRRMMENVVKHYIYNIKTVLKGSGDNEVKRTITKSGDRKRSRRIIGAVRSCSSESEA